LWKQWLELAQKRAYRMSSAFQAVQGEGLLEGPFGQGLSVQGGALGSLAGGFESQFSEKHPAIRYALKTSLLTKSPQARLWTPASWQNRAWPEEKAQKAGLGSALSGPGFWEARTRLAGVGALGGFCVGLVASYEAAFAGLLAGGIYGWRLLSAQLDRAAAKRARLMERSLSEMLDVVALGLRSGLSFEKSLDLYTDSFRNDFARSLKVAHRQWEWGLVSRTDALRALAATYDSPLLNRVVENMVRSLRFGSSLARHMEDAAREARVEYKAAQQERVAKTPVKMMVPTGALILPAMLILVLGPVLLELAGGF
jgi:tight adherence protein C